jgi:glyoxylase-like metal-dependent hydrolase (beta-lactamase superfamily II)
MAPFLLVAAQDNGTSLRSAGRFLRGGRAFDAVTFVQRDRSALTLLIDAQTHRLEGFETIRADGVHGDATELTRFSGYRDFAGVLFPTKRTEYLNGNLAREIDYSLKVNVALEAALFELPRHVVPATEATEPRRLRRIGAGVYLDTDMGGVMIVEFRDFMVVVECPGDYGMSQSTIDAVAREFPGKPIRHVVPSHTHGDHGGGARAYYQLGATVLTTPGHVEFYERLATVFQSIRPDPQSRNPRKPVIEAFSRKRVITDGEQVLELHDVGPNAHSEELTIAYLPVQRILWQADLVLWPATGKAVNKATPIAREFAATLQALGIVAIDQAVDAHHSRVIAGDDFRRALGR